MSIANFIPAVWANDILKALQTILVYGNPDIINSDYEGEISAYGDTVKISMLGDVTVKDYTRNADIDAPETLNDSQLTLTIDQQKYFNFQIDDVDKRQAKPELRAEAADRAAYGLRKTYDSFIAGLFTDIDASNFVGSDASPITGYSADSKLAYNQLVDLGVKLDNTDTPEEGRWAVLPPWYVGRLEKDDRFVGFGTLANRGVLEAGMTTGPNGLVGEAAGFRIYKSNQVPNVAGAKHKVIAGHKMAWSKADQILETEAYRPERRFADALKGLNVYGAKVVRPSNLVCLVTTDG